MLKVDMRYIFAISFMPILFYVFNTYYFKKHSVSIDKRDVAGALISLFVSVFFLVLFNLNADRSYNEFSVYLQGYLRFDFVPLFFLLIVAYFFYGIDGLYSGSRAYNWFIFSFIYYFGIVIFDLVYFGQTADYYHLFFLPVIKFNTVLFCAAFLYLISKIEHKVKQVILFILLPLFYTLLLSVIYMIYRLGGVPDSIFFVLFVCVVETILLVRFRDKIVA